MKKKGRRFFRRPFFCPRIRKKACGAGITRMMPAEKTPPAQGRGLCSVSFRSLCPLGTEKRLQRDGGEGFSGAERCAEAGRRSAILRPVLPKACREPLCRGMVAERGKFRLRVRHHKDEAAPEAPPAQGRGLCSVFFRSLCPLGTEKCLQRDGGEVFSGAERCAETGRRSGGSRSAGAWLPKEGSSA